MKQDEIFTAKLSAGRRTYFFDVKETSKGDRYLRITETIKRHSDIFEKHHIMVFNEDIEDFAALMSNTFLKLREPLPNNSVEEDKLEPNHNAYKIWTHDEDEKLEHLFSVGKTTIELAQIFGREKCAIKSRIKKLGLREKY